MATRKKQELIVLDQPNYDKVKEEIILLLTGHDINSGEKFDYMTLLKRVTIILIALYGVGKIQIVRQLAFSIVTTLMTRWLAQKAIDTVMPLPAVKRR
jgi:hypothetical protein